MPIYEYECAKCENVFEAQQKMSEAPLSSCPSCDGPVKKLISTSSFALKGGGWYTDGYGSSGGGCSAASSCSTAAPAAGSSAPACAAGGCCAAKG